MFRDRADAGTRLAWELGRYRDRKDALVLAIPRGGMPVGGALARELVLPLNAMLVAKLEHPDDREAVIGAVSLTETELDPAAAGDAGVSEEYVAAAVEKIRSVLRRRYWSYHEAVRFESVTGRIAILTDDEAGSDRPMLAAIRRLRREGAVRIVAAVPVATRAAFEALLREADEAICLRIIEPSAGAGEFYMDFQGVTEDEALEALRHHSATVR